MARTTQEKEPRKIGYAVIGLGHIAQHVVLPAFKNAGVNSQLVALVSGDGEKRAGLGARYQVPTFDYSQLDECLDRPEVDAVYIALPNDMHAEYTERCARKGVHVLCEKPMALSTQECMRMIRACEEADVKLMIAYRLHLDRANLTGIKRVLSGKIGDPRYFSSEFSFQVKEDNIRVSAERGGGPQWDIGIYCINAARYLFRDEPTEVMALAAARKDDPRFSETHEQLSVLMRFPHGRLAQFTCGFGAAYVADWELVGTRGRVRLKNAYEYEGSRTLTWSREPGKMVTRTFRPTDQFGPELIYFSSCILENREPEMNGWEGLADVRVIEAINSSVEDGRVLKLGALEKRERPVPEMVLTRPARSTEKLVQAEAPSQE